MLSPATCCTYVVRGQITHVINKADCHDAYYDYGDRCHEGSLYGHNPLVKDFRLFFDCWTIEYSFKLRLLACSDS